MRPIKFRVWNGRTNKWVHAPTEEVNLFGEMILLGGFMRDIRIDDLNDCIPLQFTGLKDKNGKEIYDGDILKQTVKNRPEIISAFSWEVKYFEDLASFGMTSGNCFETFEDVLKDDDVDWELEIIGHIYGN